MNAKVLRDKHLKLDQTKIDKARRFLGLKTEQQTIDMALDAVLAEKAIVGAHRKARAVGGFEDVFASDAS